MKAEMAHLHVSRLLLCPFSFLSFCQEQNGAHISIILSSSAASVPFPSFLSHFQPVSHPKINEHCKHFFLSFFFFPFNTTRHLVNGAVQPRPPHVNSHYITGKRSPVRHCLRLSAVGARGPAAHTAHMAAVHLLLCAPPEFTPRQDNNKGRYRPCLPRHLVEK